jgi:protein-tyrosine phosphatase
MEFFDIHSHMLPGVDDGAENLEEAMAMIDLAYNEGTRKLILTPHYVRGGNDYKENELPGLFENFRDEVGKVHPDMELFLGNEILYEEGVISDLKEGLIQTINNTKYVLVEFNIRTSYVQLYEAMQKLANARFRPIIAHVERYRCLFKHIERIEELTRMEVLLQMNISSVYGGLLDENARWCKKLVKEGYISLFGTDAHDMEDRAPYIKEYASWIEKKCGGDYLESAFWDNPQKIIENKYIID